ncbi:MAG TPA: hypothetical protein VJI33_04420 [Candidatus Paceibacterota bacterium]
MATHKYIYWRPDSPKNEAGETFANVHLLVGYNQASISDFRKMADELRKTFPQATDDEICGGKVFKSSFVAGFTIVTWGAHIPTGDYPDWQQKPNGNMEYHW